MKKLLTVALAIGLMSVASAANAQLRIFVEANGESYLENTTGDEVTFDAYQITSSTGGLDPDGWNGIGEQGGADPLAIIGSLGAGALAFGAANPSATNLAELNVSGVARLPGNGRFSIGMPFVGGDISGAAAAGNINGTPNVAMDIVKVPEPASVVMAALALLGLVGYIRRR